jgi:hypothetical protein
VSSTPTGSLTFSSRLRRTGMTEKQVKQISGHSPRVGATEEMLSFNIDFSSVMQAGR